MGKRTIVPLKCCPPSGIRIGIQEARKKVFLSKCYSTSDTKIRIQGGGANTTSNSEVDKMFQTVFGAEGFYSFQN